jgi:nucleoid-associated protein YgaU
MSGFAARIGWVAGALLLTLSLAACASWRSEAPAHMAQAPVFGHAALSAPSAPSPAARPAERAAVIALESGPEDYVCVDGSRVRIDYAQARDVANVSLNEATPIAMRRADEDGIAAYRSESVLLLRAGPRIALSSAAASVVVRGGDTLGAIAERIYGDRMRAFDIARANADQIADPNLIYPGQVLHLPQTERRCRRTLRQDISYAPPALERRAFSPPSRRQPDQQRVLVTAGDRARR